MYEIIPAGKGFKITRIIDGKREYLVKHLNKKTWWSEDPTNAKFYNAKRSVRMAIEKMKGE
jgi:hypothetical protein